MPKLVVTVEDKLLLEWSLNDKEVIIGRGTDCNVVVRDPLVSRHHAKIVKAYGGYFVEDLDSTNGVTVNGRRVHKQMLKYGDRVQIGTHDFCLTTEEVDDTENDDDGGVTVAAGPGGAVRRPASVAAKPQISVVTPQIPTIAPVPAEKSGGLGGGRAHVRFLTGHSAGTTDVIEKALYSIGEPGGNLAVISRRGQIYVLQNLGKGRTTTINGEPVLSGAGVPLKTGDRIRVGDAQLEFFIES